MTTNREQHEAAAELDQTEAEVEQQSEDAFTAGFAGEDGPVIKDATAEEGEELEDETVVDESLIDAQSGEDADPLASTETTDKSAEDLLREQLEQMASRLRNIEGRYGSMNGELKKMQGAAAERLAAEAQPEKTIAELVQSGEKVSALKEDWSEMSEAIAEAAETIEGRNRINPDDLVAQAAAKVREETESIRNMAQLDYAYPGWEQEVATEKFNKWLGAQDENVRVKMNSPHASDAIDLLSAYSQFIAPEQEEAANRRLERQERLSRSVAPTNGKTAAPREKRLTSDEAFLAGYKSAR